MNSPFIYASPTLSVEALKHSIAYKLMFTIGKDPAVVNKHEWLDVHQVYYLSMEFLLGRMLSNALLAMGIYENIRVGLDEMGLELDDLLTKENDPGLGNGGLGWRALPVRGYGIRYEYGMFKQNIVNGQQAPPSLPDYWLE